MSHRSFCSGRLAVLGLAGAALLAAPAFAETLNPISADELTATVKVLASDAFEGRAPGTGGETKTVDYLIGRFKALGLQPGGEGGSFIQSVPLVRTQVAPAPRLELADAGSARALTQGQDIYVWTLRPVTEVAIQRAPLVFVGYGVAAPERRWDDFKGADLHGKIAVFLINDPDFEASADEPVAGKFGGKAMTYYGRWTYKFEEAARKGALGALIVHETPGAGYGWSTVIAGQGEAYDVARSNDEAQPLLLQGWLQRDAAVEVFRRAGLDFEALKRASRREDFEPVVLKGESLSATLKITHAFVQSHNVLAKLPGTDRPGETILYGAHWDAYGIGQADQHGETIRRGANDDGLGVAGVLEIARVFSRAPAPKRTIVYAIWTAEERGLLGSETYAQHPLYPLATTVANLTMDILETAGPSHDVVLVGAGQDSLEGDLRRAARQQGRRVTADTHPEKGLFYRADHFSLAKRGVPTVLLMALGGGPDLVDGGQAAGQKWVDDYTANCYHKTCDAWSSAWDLRGAAQDVDLLFQIGSTLADTDAWPSWNKGSEFEGVRQATDAAR